jgi:hypothetical protein
MNKKIDNICYTGIGANKTGNHTRKQFLSLANRTFKHACSRYIKSLKCKSCKKSKELNTQQVYKQILAKRKNKTYKMSSKVEKKLVESMEKCNQCKSKNPKPCTLEHYITFSGATAGKCVPNPHLAK